MSNSMTEHSKQLRAKSAAKSNKEKLANGFVRRMLIQMPTETADEFDAICAELGVSRPQALKQLCEMYRSKE